MNKLVSIIIPIYNMGNNLETCLNSILNQDYSEMEIILIDDGSTDDSLVVAKKMAAKDNRIFVYHTENRGSGPARNEGIRVAKGKYAYFPDADDYIEPNTISLLVKYIESGNYDLVVFGFKNINSKGKITSTKIYINSSFKAKDLRDNYSQCIGFMNKWAIQGAPWNKFFDLNLIKEKNIEFPPLRRHQDEGFISRYMCHANNILFIDEVLYSYYVNDLRKEWQKYPVNYIDSVIGLFDIRKQTILSWNKDDLTSKDMIDREYICNCIKAMELCFSPKMSLNLKQRKQWIQDMIFKSNLNNIDVPNCLGKYQKIIMKNICNNKITTIYYLMKLKITLERSGILNKLRKKW